MSPRERDYAAIALGLLAAVGAHVSGKPWWVSGPFMGDAFDVGFMASLAFRLLLGLFASGRDQ